ncbi:MAG: hypothetical protein KA004_13160 [Verrucomicrobiales bacterium]|nr:hypothetical protein [Verrucomicrobiales bacterium]
MPAKIDLASFAASFTSREMALASFLATSFTLAIAFLLLATLVSALSVFLAMVPEVFDLDVLCLAIAADLLVDFAGDFDFATVFVGVGDFDLEELDLAVAFATAVFVEAGFTEDWTTFARGGWTGCAGCAR